ncbi:MAG: hypothetical protein KAV41_02015 [Candidatus Pacebacteria bacterium]|nr:hypothetical protein [Candidatus Paceibacterota bacterium]
MKNLEKTDWFEYIKPIYEKRKKLENPGDSRLIFAIDNNKYNKLEQLVKKVISNVVNAKQIFGITKQLNNKNEKVNPDKRIDDMIGELRAARYLVNCSYKNIVYQKKEIDFICVKDNVNYAVEVKFIRDSNFRTKRLGEGLGFDLSNEATKIIEILGKKYTKAKTQIEKYHIDDYIPFIVIVNNIPLLSNLGHNCKVKNWCDSQDTKVSILPDGPDVYENNIN